MFYSGPRFRAQARPKTQDSSEYGLRYVSGLLCMETKRNMANIGRKTDVSVQNMRHFMSNSPWSGQGLINAVQDDVKQHPEFQGGAMLILDESAGAARPHTPRPPAY